MRFVGWMYDIAREQAPREAWLHGVLRRSLGAGYGAVGLYLEHRFAYRSAPWVVGAGSMTPDTVQRLSRAPELSGLRVIPFLNTLGHMEGFLRSEAGRRMAESPGEGSAQICPGRAECVEFAWGLVFDAMAAFDDEWIHLGGDETRELGACARCAERVRAVGAAGLYGEYFGRLCRRVLQRGRRPCLWGDMLVQYPDALAELPGETVIFDWRYDGSPAETTRMFRARGFDVVCCPALRTYDAGWCFLAETWRVIDAHATAATQLDALGVLVCAWEFFGFSSLGSVLPLIFAAGRRLARGEDWTAALVAEGNPGEAHAAETLGRLVPDASAFLRPGGGRALRGRLVLDNDPFALWRAWREDACGAPGDVILRACDDAAAVLPSDSALRFPVQLHRVAVEWVRLVEKAQGRYAAGDRAGCARALAQGRAALARLRPGLQRIAEEGGSVADLDRLNHLLAAVDRVSERLEGLSGAATSWPAFASVTRPACAG